MQPNTYVTNTSVLARLTQSQYKAFATRVKRNKFLLTCDNLGAAANANNGELVHTFKRDLQVMVASPENSVQVNVEIYQACVLVIVKFDNTSLKQITLFYLK